MYQRLKALQRQGEFLDIQEEYVKDEMKNLKREMIRAKEEVKRIKSVPLVIGQFLEMVDENYGIASSTSGSTYFVRVLSTIDRELLKPNASVALHKYSHAIVDTLPPEADSSIQMLQMTEKPDVTYDDIGGMDVQKQEVREAVELPLTHFELYKQIGIDPPRGVLLYGPPGTGKTTAALALCSDVFCERSSENLLEMNASDERKLESIRTKVKQFARTSPLGADFKVIFLDEADALTADAQGALRRIMEQYSETCRFILSCNYSSKIIEPIQSRCAVFRFRPLADDQGHGNEEPGHPSQRLRGRTGLCPSDTRRFLSPPGFRSERGL